MSVYLNRYFYVCTKGFTQTTLEGGILALVFSFYSPGARKDEEANGLGMSRWDMGLWGDCLHANACTVVR